MTKGDLVLLNWGKQPELEYVDPTAWFAQAVENTVPLVFVNWVVPEHRAIADFGWANLYHPDGGPLRVVHRDYFEKVEA